MRHRARGVRAAHLRAQTVLFGRAAVATAIVRDTRLTAELAASLGALQELSRAPAERAAAAAAARALAAVSPGAVEIRAGGAVQRARSSVVPVDTALAKGEPAGGGAPPPAGASDAHSSIRDLVARLRASGAVEREMEAAFEAGSALYLMDDPRFNPAGAVSARFTFDGAVRTLILIVGMWRDDQNGPSAGLVAAALKILRKLIEMQNTALNNAAAECARAVVV